MVQLSPFERGQKARLNGGLMSDNPFRIVVDKGEIAYLDSAVKFEGWVEGFKSIITH